jgi:hypothetical protein
MHPNSESITPVRRLQRPPIRQSVLVQSEISHTFGTFVRTLALWWPVALFSSGKEAVRDVLVEERLGGRISEIWEDGTAVVWGEILCWEPPYRFVMTWTGTPATTEVEFTFVALGPALTRVTVEHRGWEALSEAQWGHTCSRPGGYSAGWERILGAFVAAIGKQPTGTRLMPGNHYPQGSIPAGFCRTKRDPRLDPSTRCCQHPSSANERSDGGRTEPLC